VFYTGEDREARLPAIALKPPREKAVFEKEGGRLTWPYAPTPDRNKSGKSGVN
jgi:hypothetical protein